MTSAIDNTIDELVRRVKNCPAVADFAFNNAYPPRNTPHPVEKYLVTVENTGVIVGDRFIGDRISANAKGAVYEISLRFRVYAPSNTSAAALLRASSQLADALERADTARVTKTMELYAVSYDTTARTLYRDLTVKLDLVQREEAGDE